MHVWLFHMFSEKLHQSNTKHASSTLKVNTYLIKIKCQQCLNASIDTFTLQNITVVWLK